MRDENILGLLTGRSVVPENLTKNKDIDKNISGGARLQGGEGDGFCY